MIRPRLHRRLTAICAACGVTGSVSAGDAIAGLVAEAFTAVAACGYACGADFLEVDAIVGVGTGAQFTGLERAGHAHAENADALATIRTLAFVIAAARLARHLIAGRHVLLLGGLFATGVRVDCGEATRMRLFVVSAQTRGFTQKTSGEQRNNRKPAAQGSREQQRAHQ